ncbi:MAG: hypothetical protein II956_16050 [Bacteroidales bacterium]|nr:hypothetical protein [Bacteroidales bacterium]
MSNITKIGKYIFRDGILEPRNIEKGVLAYFYECTPPTFRAQLQRKGIAEDNKNAKMYTAAETKQIFEEFGPVYYESALEGWRKWLIFRQTKQKNNNKYKKNKRKNIKNTDFTNKFSIHF